MESALSKSEYDFYLGLATALLKNILSPYSVIGISIEHDKFSQHEYGYLLYYYYQIESMMIAFIKIMETGHANVSKCHHNSFQLDERPFDFHLN